MFILASNSPRRVEILNKYNYNFQIKKSEIEEKINNKLKPQVNAINNALLKAQDISQKHPNKVVVAADTIVVYKNTIYGKPKDLDDAYNMLKILNNKTHYVITGMAIVRNNKIRTFYKKSKVIFKNNNDDEIKSYIMTKEPLGKAGSYAIQGEAIKLIKTFKGDYYNIMGLPIKKFNKEFNKFLK